MADCKNKLNKWDYAVAVSSGALTAALDVFFVGDISLSEAHKWGMEKVEPFIIGVANSQGFKGTGLEGTVLIRQITDTAVCTAVSVLAFYPAL